MDTVYSLSDDVPLVELIDEPVEESVLQPGSVVAGSIRQVCLIRKISAGGAVLHADIPLDEGRRLELELETGERLEGRIVWRRGSELGLRFDEAIDVLPILARNLVSQPGERRRMPRVEVACPGQIQTEMRNALVVVQDIAQGGLKLEGPVALRLEEKVTVTPEGLRPIAGLVRWSRGGTAGIEFDSELDWQELMPWLRARRHAAPVSLSPPLEPEPPGDPVQGSARSDTIQLNLPARVREGTRRWGIDVASLTSRSVEFDCFAALRLGSLLWVVLPGLEGWPARIVAIDGYRFTCEFTQPLHPAVLERILASATPALN